MSESELERKILVVDDESACRTKIKGVLETLGYTAKRGYHVEEADNGLTAIEKARSTKYYLITMDWIMPTSETSGHKAIQEIRKFNTKAS